MREIGRLSMLDRRWYGRYLRRLSFFGLKVLLVGVLGVLGVF
jgi:hypothetical protein